MTKRFIVFNKAGKILRTGRCSDSLFELQADAGETVIEGVANDETDRITQSGKLKRNVRKKKARPKPLKMSFKKVVDAQRTAAIKVAIAESPGGKANVPV